MVIQIFISIVHIFFSIDTKYYILLYTFMAVMGAELKNYQKGYKYSFFL